MRNADFAELHQVVNGFGPLNMATAANNGGYVSLKNFHRLTILFTKGVGTASEDPTITLTQATDVAGTGAKALNFERLWLKQHASSLPATFTRVTKGTVNNTYTNDTLAEELAIIAIDITPDMLDVDGGFDCVQAAVADVGTNAQLGQLVYILDGAFSPPLTAQAN